MNNIKGPYYAKSGPVYLFIVILRFIAHLKSPYDRILHLYIVIRSIHLYLELFYHN